MGIEMHKKWQIKKESKLQSSNEERGNSQLWKESLTDSKKIISKPNKSNEDDRSVLTLKTIKNII